MTDKLAFLLFKRQTSLHVCTKSLHQLTIIDGQERRWLLVSLYRCGKPLARGFSCHIREESARESASLGMLHGSGNKPCSALSHWLLKRFPSPGRIACHAARSRLPNSSTRASPHRKKEEVER